MLLCSEDAGFIWQSGSFSDISMNYRCCHFVPHLRAISVQLGALRSVRGRRTLRHHRATGRRMVDLRRRASALISCLSSSLMSCRYMSFYSTPCEATDKANADGTCRQCCVYFTCVAQITATSDRPRALNGGDVYLCLYVQQGTCPS